MALSKIDVSKMITGVTPLTNGGTGGTSIPATNLASGVTGTLPVGSGGTGLTSGTTDQLLKFTGSTTLASSAISTGKVLQVLQNDQQSPISTTTSGYAICTQAITPSLATSKILIHAYCTGQHTSSSGCGISITREIGGAGQASVCTFNSIGSRRGVFGGQAYSGSATDRTDLMGGAFLHSPSTTSAITYRMNTSIETGTFFINRTSDDTDNGHSIRTVSRIIVMEIGA